MYLKIDLTKTETPDWLEDALKLDLDLLALELGDFLKGQGLDKHALLRVSLSFVTQEAIRDYNKRYREIDEPTDVLSFPLWEEHGRFCPPDEWDELPLGDVLISPGYIYKSAKGLNIDYNRETALVIIHGVLHLVGFDHDTDDRERLMWDKQEAILQRYFERIDACDKTNPRED